MTYALSPRLFIENGPAASAAALKPADSYRAWRKLDSDRRLELIEEALAPAKGRLPESRSLAC